MREIKFRGRDALTRRWVYGDSIKHTDNASGDGKVAELTYIGSKIPDARKVGAMKWNVVDPSTIGQYTDIKDKNGREIYEGDIVHYVNPYLHRDYKAPVVFNHGDFCLEKSRYHLITMGNFDDRCFEVIGNIHEEKKGE